MRDIYLLYNKKKEYRASMNTTIAPGVTRVLCMGNYLAGTSNQLIEADARIMARFILIAVPRSGGKKHK